MTYRSTANRDVDDWVKERDDALTALDLDWARKQAPGLRTESLLCGMHKARYEATRIAPELRHASRHWLEENGYHRLNSLPWPPQGELPK